ncbi:hypothetical protein GCM10009745_05040 [Kribbella yunnanensis]|uniref:Methyltransferase domain-containing protein n=1 Tax=Kribbella yunnanensis TaxID=190194 RepID=A0ABP4S1S5_9ACTN
MNDADGRLLAKSNLSYRRPELYDAMQADDGVVSQVIGLVGEREVSPAQILDLGCGTGRHLAGLRDAFGAGAVGVDLQERMVRYGRPRYGVDLRCGDMRLVRLGRRFDLVTCLGNSLSYLRTVEDLRLVAETMRMHLAHRGVVVLATLMTPQVELAMKVVRVETDLVAASVEVGSVWEAEQRVQVMHRTWRHDDGTIDVDVLRRRVFSAEELDGALRGAGFSDVQLVSSGLVVAS